MANSSDEAPASLSLHCLGGREPPPEVVSELRLLAELPARAHSGLWRALGPCLGDAPALAGGAAAIEQRLEELCGESGVSSADLSRVIRSARFLLREAARLDIERPLFERDLDAIFSGDGERGHRAKLTLLAGFDAAMAELRAEILEGTLADHGKLLVGVDWRVDTLSTSSRGVKLRTPVVVLTLRYQDGERRERITLQALPGVLEQLRRVCENILE